MQTWATFFKSRPIAYGSITGVFLLLVGAAERARGNETNSVLN